MLDLVGIPKDRFSHDVAQKHYSSEMTLLPAGFKNKTNGHFALICLLAGNMSRVMRKPTFWFPTWSNTNQVVQLQKMARGLKFRI